MQILNYPILNYVKKTRIILEQAVETEWPSA